MAESVALAGLKWFASSPFLIDLLKKGYSYLGVDVAEKLRDLEKILIPRMEILIEAAKESPHEERLRGWLKSLEDAVYEAEDALDLHDYYLLKQKVKSSAGGIKVRLESLPLIKYLLKNCSIVPQNIRLKKSLMNLEKTAAKANEILLLLGVSNVPESQTTKKSGRMVTTSRLTHKVIGRDKDCDHVINLLHDSAGLEPESSSIKNYSIVAIVGLGGAGKTTLAQYVCDHEKEAKHFDVIMWVHVSQILDVEKLTREMVESASGKGCDLTSRDKLQEKLEVSLRSKKFLLVLDDVWSEKEAAELQWEQLLAPLRVGNRGSKILMTTREKGVAVALGAHGRNIVYLKDLEENDFLSLFTYYAFGDPKIDDNELCKKLEEIVKENAAKLRGSPLAARMVGSQLRKKPDVDFWKMILSRDLLKDTRKSLLWSYQNLEAHLQRCFSYCSLFSKGYEIERKKLIHLWVAEGFIKTVDESERIEDIGQDYFDELLSSSFFQPMEDDDLYTIHDLLHDLTEMVSKDRYLRVEGNPIELKQLPILSLTLKSLVLSACSLPIVSKEDLAIIRSIQDVRISQVATFMEGLVATYGSHIVSEIEWDLRRGYDKQKLRNWLEKAMDIVYQNQQEEEAQLVLPHSLKSLDISSCPLTNSTLREGLRGLASLKSLKLCNIVSLTSLPSADVLGCLTMLEELHIKQCWFLTSLGGLEALGSLWKLIVSFCPNLSAEGGSTSILPSSLEMLEIEACDWKHLDDSLSDPTSAIDSEGSNINPFAASLHLGHLKSLWSLRITNCPNIGSLLGLQELNNLANLFLMGCPKLAHAETKLASRVIRDFITDAPSLLYVLLAEETLASLRRLDIEEFKEESFRSEEEQVLQHLTSLKELEFKSCSIKSLPNNLESLSSLEDLTISDCPNIMSLPDLPRSLSQLYLIGCNPVLKRRCQKPHGQDWCKISHIREVTLDWVVL
uniref:Disease resistance protein RGA3 n=1 Tax=Ananas comosus var. bracteatus TaxID=296719 RepID=A0A6V7QIA9_ANACO|nr:unnamed protein product [Ananas comosus var. bracteatus]